uniref:uncharacterized protein LOC122604701 n=1 Tax=Erigeron canadensis TaxID=72917 RepID=UPI001CB9538C|nr:uncharacterized protein LOC122604701 [Erigeron canadensis]
MGKRKRLCIISESDDEGGPAESQGEQHMVEDVDNLNQAECQSSDMQSLEIDCSNEEHSDQGPLKKPRGPTQKPEIWSMKKSTKIGVTFNSFGKPVGDEGNELVQYLGTLVRMSQHVEIHYPDWRKVPLRKKEDMYLMVKEKFVFYPAETNLIKKWIIHSMGKKWRTWKGSLKARAYDSSCTIDEIVKNETMKDSRVNPVHFKDLVTRWFTPEFQTTCEKKRGSRSKMEEPHITGTKSFARLAHEVEILNNGVSLTRGELYIKSRTRKNGNTTDDKAAEVVASLKALPKDSTNTLSEKDDFSNDDYSKVKGPEKGDSFG